MRLSVSSQLKPLAVKHRLGCTIQDVDVHCIVVVLYRAWIIYIAALAHWRMLRGS